MPLRNIIRIFQTIKKLQSAQEFSLEIRSGEITRKRTVHELSFWYATLLLDLIYVPTIYYLFHSNTMVVLACTRFLLQGNNYITKKVRVVSLPRDTPTGPPLHPYQILSSYLKMYGSYGLHKILVSGVIII